jgi:hypothetical protein
MLLQGGLLQLWPIEPPDALGNGADGPEAEAAAAAAASALPLAELRLGHSSDLITRALPLGREPYLLLGCGSGAVRVAAMVNASGTPVTAARQVRGLTLMPYSSESAQGLRGAPREVRGISKFAISSCKKSSVPSHSLLGCTYALFCLSPP